jgi:hypothetical protein
MDHEYEERPGWVRLPGYDDNAHPGGATRARADGVRRVRRAANWTAAALIAGVAAATGYFAHHPPAAAPAAVTPVTGTAGGSAVAGGVHQPSLSSPVATSSGSGVTVSTGPGGAKIYTYHGDD